MLCENYCRGHELSLVVINLVTASFGYFCLCCVTDRWSPIFWRNLLWRR